MISTRLFFTTLFSAVGAAGIVLFGSNAIEANVRPTISNEITPLPVVVVPYQIEDHYVATTRFLGVIEASTDSNVGFEVPGLLQELMVSEGDYVNTGQILARLDTRQQRASLALAKAQEKEVAAQLKLARLALSRAISLLEQNLISQREVDEAVLAVDTAIARLETTQASVENAQIVIDKSSLVAPFDAVVSRKLTEPGSIVGPNVPVVRLVSVGGREAHIGLSPKYADIVRLGADYPLLAGDQRLVARLRTVGDDVDPQTLTVLSVLTLAEDQSLRVGQTVAIELSEDVAASGGWLPTTALLEGDKGLWTVLVTRGNELGETITVRESVEVVHSNADRVFVRGTLPNNAFVVASGLQKLSPGSPVEVVPSIRVTN
ncbi:MAG: Multidrug resistance protein MdtA [Halieaceae bacterium]|nr:MAG: Multidrug resistance protein MdtA [Halieaceae bacterium]